MPAKEEEVKKYRDAAIGNAAIVEDQHSSLGLHQDYTHHLDLVFPINRRRAGRGKEKKKSDDSHV